MVGNMGNHGLCILIGLVLAHAANGATEVSPPHHETWSFQDFRHIPIQAGGRVKPLDSFTREATLFMTGRRKFEGYDPSDLVLSVARLPPRMGKPPIVKISRIDVRRAIADRRKPHLFHPRELFGNFALLQYARNMDAQAMAGGSETMSGKSDRGKKEGPREQGARQCAFAPDAF